MDNRAELTWDKGPPTTWLEVPRDDQHLGKVAEIDELATSLKAYIGEAPFAVSAKYAATKLGLEGSAWLENEQKGTQSWFVGTSFSVEHLGRLQPDAIGLELVFRDDERGINTGQKVHVHSLFPSPEYRTVGSVGLSGMVEFRARLNSPGLLSHVLDTETIDTGDAVSIDADAQLKASATARGEIDISAQLVTPIVSAIGVGDTRAQWCFHRWDRPLVDRDLMTWSGLILDEKRQDFEYLARLFVVFKLGVYTFRRHSKELTLSCDLGT